MRVTRAIPRAEKLASAAPAVFPYPCAATRAVSEVVETRSSHLAVSDDFDALDDGRVDEEGAFDSHLMRNAAHCEALARSATSSAKDNALEYLRSLPVAFFYHDRYPDGVSGAKVVDFRIGSDRRKVMCFHCRFVLRDLSAVW